MNETLKLPYRQGRPTHAGYGEEGRGGHRT